MSKLNCVEEYSWNELRGFVKNKELKKYCSKGSIQQIRDLIDDRQEERKQLQMWYDGSMKRLNDGLNITPKPKKIGLRQYGYPMNKKERDIEAYAQKLKAPSPYKSSDYKEGDPQQEKFIFEAARMHELLTRQAQLKKDAKLKKDDAKLKKDEKRAQIQQADDRPSLLDKMTIVQLIADAKKNGIKGYSGKNRAALLKYIKQKKADRIPGPSEKHYLNI